MTVQTSTSTASFAGNGVTSVFPIGFKFNSAADLIVSLIEDATGGILPLTLNSQYTVSGAGDDSGGAITMLSPPAAGQTLSVRRVIAILQPTDLRNQGSFFAEVHEEALDLLTMIDQQQQDEINIATALAHEAADSAEAMVGRQDAFEISAGYAEIGDYAAGLSITARNQIFLKDGEYYRASAGLALPYTTTGVWAGESASFVGIGDAVLRQDLSQQDGARLVGGSVPTVADVTALRSYAGRYDNDRVRLLQYGASPGIGEGVFRRITSATPADNGVTVFGVPGNIRWIREESSGPIDARWAGAVPASSYSAGMADSKDAVALAQSAAGINGVVHFPLPAGWTEAHYLLNATGINLAGSLISADPGVVIHAPFTSDNEGEKPRTVGDVVFSEEAPAGSSTYLTERGENAHPLIAGISAGMAAAAISIPDRQRKFSFVDDARAVRISSLDTGAFTLDATGMTIAANQVLWTDATAAGADYQGVEFAAAAGAEIECLAHNVSNGGASGSFYVGVRAVGAAGAASACRYYKFTIAAGAYQIYSGTTLLQTVIFNNEADRFNDVQGPVRVGVRVGANSRFMQLILNGKNYGEIDLGSAIAHSIFFLADQAGRATIQFKYPIARCRDSLVATKPLKIACLGDSITRGARSTTEWPQLVREFAQHLPGIGQITQLTNMAVSGISAATVAATIGSYDFSGYDYVLVMLGTNDCQGGGNGGAGAYYSNIVNIGSAIAAAGARPIFGVIPTYTGAAETGNGNATTNVAYIPMYQQIIRERILNAGWALADVDDFFGNNYGFPGSFDSGLSTSWYHDNIHPNTKGQIAVAAAFSAALSRLAVRPVRGCYVTMIKPQGTFAITGESTSGMPRAVLQGNVVSIHGAVSGGATSQVIGTLPAWARPAGYVRSSIFARTGGAQVLASVEARNDGSLVSGLSWGTEQADLSMTFHA